MTDELVDAARAETAIRFIEDGEVVARDIGGAYQRAVPRDGDVIGSLDVSLRPAGIPERQIQDLQEELNAAHEVLSLLETKVAATGRDELLRIKAALGPSETSQGNYPLEGGKGVVS